MSDMVRRLMGQQRNRLVGTLMSNCEKKPWWDKLSHGERMAFKEDIQRSVGVYHDFMLDVVKVGGEDELRGDVAIEALRRIEQGVALLSSGVASG